MSPLHYYDAAVQLARTAARALTEEEYEVGLAAAEQIVKWCVPIRYLLLLLRAVSLLSGRGSS